MATPRFDLPFCDCRWLERAAHDPDCPIEFDPRLNEYNLLTSNGGMMGIYHCPFCSGRAPESLRAKMFETVSVEETHRLHHLTMNLKTEKDVRAALGEPTDLYDPGATSIGPDKSGEPGEIRTWKTMRYSNQSATAVINVNVDRHGKVTISWRGKHIGSPKEANGDKLNEA
jgi:hypothetical protein